MSRAGTAPAGGGARGSLRGLRAAYEAGRYEEVVARGTAMLARDGTPSWKGKVRYFTAMGHLYLGKPEPGARLLGEARAYLTEAGDEHGIVECMAAASSVAQMRQAPDAMDLAQSALTACRRLRPVPPELQARILGLLASALVADGEWVLAIAAYQEALERVGPLFDMRRQAKLFNDVSIAYRELGQLDLAIRHATRSVELHATLREHVSLARSENNLGLMLMERGDLTESRSHLERSLQLCEETGLEAGRCNVLLSLCELSLVEGHPERASSLAKRALQLATRLGEEPNVGHAHSFLARAAEALFEPEVADEEMTKAIGMFGRLGMREWLVRAHRQYADMLERRGALQLAYRHMKEALAQESTAPAKSADGRAVRE